jgi:hypothetical protein
MSLNKSLLGHNPNTLSMLGCYANATEIMNMAIKSGGLQLSCDYLLWC